MQDGDKNTEFFHASVNSTRSKNNLQCLVDDYGEDHFSDKEKGEVAIQFFNQLFKSSNLLEASDLLANFQPRVSSEINADLSKFPSIDEIRAATFSINSDSAPVPDGLTGFFFKKYWEIIKYLVISEVQSFFKTGILPKEWNHTNLCLIPKIQAATKMTDLRPISLCSVLYKIVSKILVNRLKRHLPKLISPTQAAFVSERMISDNILIAHEAIHSLHSHQNFSKSSMLLKTDMSKADRLEWTFLKGILQVMGFSPIWITWIMGCVTSVSYSVLINDQPYGFIIPEV